MSIEKKIAFILKNASGIGNVKGRKIIDSVDKTDLDSFIDSVKNLVSAKDYEAICDAVKNIDFEEIEDDLYKREIGVIVYGEKDYPDSLVRYDDMPIVLYYKGDKSLLNERSIAVVGTRFPSSYGMRATEEFTKVLAGELCIVSGMAKGVDSCAHRAALEAGGKTIAVLGCGVDVVYPSNNYELYRNVINKGLLISEYDPDERADAYNFPSRNRIISGLSGGVLVTEAGEKSGTMHTVKCAEKQGKPVYCVPGSIYSQTSIGCNALIRDGKGIAVVTAYDIFRDQGIAIKDNKKSEIPLDNDVQTVYGILRQRGESHFDELIEETELSVPKLSAALIKGEALGMFTKTKSNFWSVY